MAHEQDVAQLGALGVQAVEEAGAGAGGVEEFERILRDGLEGEGAGFFDCGRGRDDVEAVDFAWRGWVSLGGFVVQRELRLLCTAAACYACCTQRDRVITYS